VQGVIADSAGGAWTFGGSILTFAFPMILFIVVAGALYVLYTKPEFVPGHRPDALERPVSYTSVPGKPAATSGGQAVTPAGQAGPAAETTETTDTTEATPGEAAETGDTE
jgi:hypothetical protein